MARKIGPVMVRMLFEQMETNCSIIRNIPKEMNKEEARLKTDELLRQNEEIAKALKVALAERDPEVAEELNL